MSEQNPTNQSLQTILAMNQLGSIRDRDYTKLDIANAAVPIHPFTAALLGALEALLMMDKWGVILQYTTHCPEPIGLVARYWPDPESPLLELDLVQGTLLYAGTLLGEQARDGLVLLCNSTVTDQIFSLGTRSAVFHFYHAWKEALGSVV